MATQVSRRLEFDAGHRLIKHEGKCANYHGHRYVVEVTVEAAALDRLGRVVDFGVIKSLVGGWIDETLDHGMILQEGDPMIPFLEEHEMKLCVVPRAPTAEYLAELIDDRARGLLPDSLSVVQVVVHETPNCAARYVRW